MPSFLPILTAPLDVVFRRVLPQGVKNSLYLRAVSRWGSPWLAEWALRVGGRYIGADSTWSLATRNGKVRIMKWVLERGETISPFYQQMSLHIAINVGHPDAVRLIVDVGTDVNGMKYDNEFSALDRAIEAGNEEIEDVLRHHGALIASEIAPSDPAS